MASYKSRRLARLLIAALEKEYPGERITLDPEQIYPALGFYRTSPAADCMRWEATYYRGTCPGSIGSWDTITECIKGLRIKSVGRAMGWDASAL